MKPKPFSALNHFTVPCATCAPTVVRADGLPTDRGGRVELFRPSNTNVEPNRRRTYSTKRLVRPDSRTRPTRSGEALPEPGTATHPGGSPDETGRPDRRQRRRHPVGRPDDRLQRVEGLQALPGVQDDGLLRRVQPAVLDQ